MFTEEEFDKTLNLMEIQPWLKERRAEYLALLKEFSQPQLRDLIIELLQETICIDSGQYFAAFDQIRNQIENEWNITLQQCAFVSSNSEGRVSSSHEALHQLRNEAWQGNVGPNRFVITFREALDLLPQGGTLVIVDDFVGSGGTIEKVIDWFEAEFEKVGVNVDIYVATVSGCREGIQSLRERAADCFCVHNVPKGISDRWTGAALADALAAMEEMENQLQTKSRKSLERFRFGWGRQEAVYHRERGRTPNNVFPIFWWTDVSIGSRKSVMVRR